MIFSHNKHFPFNFCLCKEVHYQIFLQGMYHWMSYISVIAIIGYVICFAVGLGEYFWIFHFIQFITSIDLCFILHYFVLHFHKC